MITPTTAEVLLDGTMLDLVCKNGSSKLLVWQNGKPRISTHFRFGEKTYGAQSLDQTTLRAVRFARGVATFGSTGELFRRILNAASRLSGIPSRELQPVVYWALSSFFPEILPMLPTLIVAGPSPAHAHHFLRVLRCFCRRGILVAELTPAGFLALPLHLRPTLLVEQSKLPGRLRALLQAASKVGVYLPRGGGFVDLRCTSAVYCQDDDLDAGLQEGILSVSLPLAGVNLPAFDVRSEEALAAEFQPLLLRFRVQNFEAVKASTFDVPTFCSGVRELARSLGASVAGDPKLQAEVMSVLSARDEEVRSTWSRLPDFGVITTLLAFVHEKKEERMSVKTLAEFVNVVLRANGELKEFNAVEVGRVLTRLNLPRSRKSWRHDHRVNP
jgi:hypothetical protein